MYVWIKYRTNTSASYGMWVYAFVFDDGFLHDEGYIEQMFHEPWMDSDGYRGMDWSIIDAEDVPKKEVAKLLDQTMMRIENLEQYAAALVDQS